MPSVRKGGLLGGSSSESELSVSSGISSVLGADRSGVLSDRKGFTDELMTSDRVSAAELC